MNSNFEISRHGLPGFNKRIDSFITETRTNPVYATHFSGYYKEIHQKSELDMSTLITHEGKSIVALLFSADADLSHRDAPLTYFGLPAVLLVSKTIEMLVLNEAFQLLLQTLNNAGIPIANGKIAIPFKIQLKPENLRGVKIEKFFFQQSRVELRFDRVLQLNDSESTGRNHYSKSVKEAIRNKTLSTAMVSNRDSRETIEKEFNFLKELHLLSAGRLTRSERSWEMQLQMIKDGRAVLIFGKKENRTCASAFFMLNEKSAFYGVSATDVKEKIAGATHQLIDFGIECLPSLGVEQIWMGTQHSSSFSEITSKERNIEEFKSYFGGSVVTHLIARGLKQNE